MSARVPLTEQLETAIECRLAQPPTRAGMRLKTVRELAQMVGVSHESVNRSLGGLVARGILARKHGSGVYVRKVPVTPATQVLGAGMRTLKLDDIFADDAAPTRLRPEPKQARLQLDVWWDTRPLSVSNRLIQRGILDQARELGHQFQVRALGREAGGAPPREKLRAGGDGHIVLVPIAEAFHRIVPANNLPTVYIWAGNADSQFQPLVQMDMEEALQRALQLLAQQGYERIALLGWDESEARQRPLYEQTLQQLRRTYRAAAFSDATEKNDAAVARRLFARRDPPQALYVADDVMMRHILPVLRAVGCKPGQTLGLITHANRGDPLPPGLSWSRMEFDPYAAGRLAMQSLVREIESAGDELLSFSHRAAWRPGETHRRR